MYYSVADSCGCIILGAIVGCTSQPLSSVFLSSRVFVYIHGFVCNFLLPDMETAQQISMKFGS